MKVITIGRTPNNDIYFPNEAISRLHATIELKENGDLVLKDSSANGTYVNNVKVHNATIDLKKGSSINLASVQVVTWSQIEKHLNLDENEGEEKEDRKMLLLPKMLGALGLVLLFSFAAYFLIGGSTDDGQDSEFSLEKELKFDVGGSGLTITEIINSKIEKNKKDAALAKEQEAKDKYEKQRRQLEKIKTEKNRIAYEKQKEIDALNRKIAEEQRRTEEQKRLTQNVEKIDERKIREIETESKKNNELPQLPSNKEGQSERAKQESDDRSPSGQKTKLPEVDKNPSGSNSKKDVLKEFDDKFSNYYKRTKELSERVDLALSTKNKKTLSKESITDLEDSKNILKSIERWLKNLLTKDGTKIKPILRKVGEKDIQKFTQRVTDIENSLNYVEVLIDNAN